MNEKKNIDRLFQEKFKDFSPQPSPENWEAIKSKLNTQEVKKPLLPLWFRVASVAAILLLLVAIGFNKFNNNQTQELPIVDTEEKNDTDLKNNSILTGDNQNKVSDTDSNESITSSENNIIQNQPNQNKNSKFQIPNNNKKSITSNKANRQILSNNNQNKNSESNNLIANQIDQDTSLKNDKIASDKNATNNFNQLNLEEDSNSIVEDIKLKNKEALDKKESVNNTIEEALATNDSLLNKEDTEFKRWAVSPRAAPVYFNSYSDGSTIHSQFVDNDKSSLVTMSYGVTGSYAVNKRLKIRTGINQVSLNQSTNDVIVYDGAELQARGINARIDNIKLNANNSTQAFMSAKAINANVPEVLSTQSTGSLEQRFGFIEIPVEVEYAVVDKKFGVNVIGGVSTMFLNQNEIYTNINEDRALVGEATNLNDTSFSANFGLGVDYQLNEKFDLFVEPTLKYQINTFSDTSGSVTPYFVALYTGINFKF